MGGRTPQASPPLAGAGSDIASRGGISAGELNEKAPASAGGVAMSGLEMSQNSARLDRDEEDLRAALKKIMGDIHGACVEQGDHGGGYVDYVRGANVAGFKKVADAMLAFGVV